VHFLIAPKEEGFAFMFVKEFVRFCKESFPEHEPKPKSSNLIITSASGGN